MTYLSLACCLTQNTEQANMLNTPPNLYGLLLSQQTYFCMPDNSGLDSEHLFIKDIHCTLHQKPSPPLHIGFI